MRRTIEISDQLFEAVCLRFITVKSAHLKGRGDICVFVPPGIKENETVPVVILLHGVYGSAWSWALNGGAHVRALDMIKQGLIPPMIIAMPSDGLWGDGSAYLPHNGFDFEKWITEDVIGAVSEKINPVQKDTPLFIGGLSMGGFGALRIAAKYGTLFKAVSAHSSITSIEQMKLFVEEAISAYEQGDKTDEDVYKTMVTYRGQLPVIQFDCGTGDPLVEYNRLLHRQLDQAGIAHIYEEFPGAHEWVYWQQYIRRTLLFFAEQL